MRPTNQNSNETVKYVLEHSGASLLFVGKLDSFDQQVGGSVRVEAAGGHVGEHRGRVLARQRRGQYLPRGRVAQQFHENLVRAARALRREGAARAQPPGVAVQHVDDRGSALAARGHRLQHGRLPGISHGSAEYVAAVKAGLAAAVWPGRSNRSVM